jgi:dihydrofolate reductase
MGRKTYDSLGKCLPDRENIVLSHRLKLFDEHPGCRHAHGIGETLHVCSNFPKLEAFVIGGALTYSQFAPLVDRYLITFVGARFPSADAFFDTGLLGPETDWHENELVVPQVDAGRADEFPFRVVELRHKKPELIEERRKVELSEYRSRNHRLNRKALVQRVQAGASLTQLLYPA